MIINVYNKLTNRHKQYTVKSFDDARKVADRLFGSHELHHGESLSDFVKRIVPKSDKHTDWWISQHHGFEDPWDELKQSRHEHPDGFRRFNLEGRPETLKKAIAESPEDVVRIREQIVNKLGGQKRLDSLRKIENFLSKRTQFPYSGYLPNYDNKEKSAIISAMRSHVPEAANLTDGELNTVLALSDKGGRDGNAFLYSKDETPLIGQEHSLSDMSFTQKNGRPSHTIDTWRYLVHNIVHRDNPESDKKFLNENYKPTQSNDEMLHPEDAKNAKLARLHAAVLENPSLIDDVLKEQKRIHDNIKNHFPKSVQWIDGKPHIGLIRGLNSAVHGQDSALSSYSDTSKPQVGEFAHRYLVPLDHVWHSYPMRSADEWGEYKHENEYLVDNTHPRVPAAPEHVFSVVPSTIEDRDPKTLSIEEILSHAVENYKNVDHIPIEHIKGANIPHSILSAVLSHKDMDDATAKSLISQLPDIKVANAYKNGLPSKYQQMAVNHLIDRYSNITNSIQPLESNCEERNNLSALSSVLLREPDLNHDQLSRITKAATIGHTKQKGRTFGQGNPHLLLLHGSATRPKYEHLMEPHLRANGFSGPEIRDRDWTQSALDSVDVDSPLIKNYHPVVHLFADKEKLP